MDGDTREIPREDVVGIYPAHGLLRHPALRDAAIFCFGGKIYPVTGPVGENTPSGAFADRPWILLFSDHAEMIRGLPSFEDEIDLHPALADTLAFPKALVAETFPSSLAEDETSEEEAQLLAEVEALLKTA